MQLVLLSLFFFFFFSLWC